MTKPAITKRAVKGSALTYNELDTNFQNLADATVGVTDGTNSFDYNLNDRIQFTAGTNITLGVNPTTGAITINASSTGNVNTGAANAIAYYPSAGTTVDDTALTYTKVPVSGNPDLITLDSGSNSLKINTQYLILKSNGGVVQIDTGSSNSFIQALGAGVAGKHFVSNTTLGNPNLTLSPAGGSQLYANNATQDFNDFAGIITIWNVNTGNVAMWLCGGQSAVKLGDSKNNTSGSVAYNVGGLGYRWTNTTGAQEAFSFGVIQLGGAG